MQSDSVTRVLQDIGRLLRDARRLARWTQHDLERRSGIDQSRISRIERGRCGTVQLAEIDRMFVVLGVRYLIDARLPVVAGCLRDAVHSRSVAYVQRRLEADGWLVRREVEIGLGRSHGWIDVLAYHPVSRVLLVIEVKTELADLGAIERSLNWYGREARPAAARLGWVPTAVCTALIVLGTAANDEAIRIHRTLIDIAFRGRATDLRALATATASDCRRSIAMVDPRSRRRAWLIGLKTDGRRSPAPYADYIEAARKLEATAK